MNYDYNFCIHETSSFLMTKQIAFYFSEQKLNSSRMFNQKIILLLEGEIGSGKTAFTKGIAKQLKIKKNINSSTFILSKIYQGKYRRMHHLDLYRLSNVNKNHITHIIFQELLENLEDNDIVVVESSEKIGSFFSFWNFKINIDILNYTKRRIKIEYNKEIIDCF
ncbi:tRNA (adenosine(37)-N6)-threonylcarbamoyltransferase complex ATPase subunit type 1 TsaE [Candidatus Phytoplasma pini]|uniref:tRNA threonylcarbamoyladenosine biosynthesis protein TsaE n=1 Tax=Candidatus Phytoplasma pini TaxID=267362 RepID=A0A559KK16_9MOLU|nr:tRNA (adenosine(37)-N6)-threonylcarbamoyltransferase complex ATPase subunit type 1 TsaE [Candidatus Phytoplasma pini]TVY12438.1 P-loop hydrolase [Candidatus Phytoplasma pini]